MGGANVSWTLALGVYLLTGLIVHKLVWETLKQRPQKPRPPRSISLRVRLVKGVKIAILLGLAVQCFLSDLAPIVSDPFVLRIVGAAIFALGWILAVAGRVQLGTNWQDIETPAVLDQQVVVARGVYRYLRHPIYIGDLLLLLGFELALNSWLIVGVVLLTPVVLARAVREESLLSKQLSGYREYCAGTKRFIPYIV